MPLPVSDPCRWTCASTLDSSRARCRSERLPTCAAATKHVHTPLIRHCDPSITAIASLLVPIVPRPARRGSLPPCASSRQPLPTAHHLSTCPQFLPICPHLTTDQPIFFFKPASHVMPARFNDWPRQSPCSYSQGCGTRSLSRPQRLAVRRGSVARRHASQPPARPQGLLSKG